MVTLIINGSSYQYPELDDQDWGDLATQAMQALASNALYPADVINDLTTGGTAVPLSAEQGKNLEDNKVNTADIIDNTTSTDADKPLSANQGKSLQDQIDASLHRTRPQPHSEFRIHPAETSRPLWTSILRGDKV